MAKDWAGDVKKFVPDADDGVIAGIVRYCGIALQNVDSSLVSYTDPVELGRVRENFLKKKLGLTQSDEALDGAIAKVGERLKGVNFKHRVTVYYMLLEHFGLLHMFAKAGTAAAEVPSAGGAALGLVAGAGAAVAAGAAASLDGVKAVANDIGDAATASVDAVTSTVGDAAAATMAGAGAAVAGAGVAFAGAAAGLKSVAAAPLGMMGGSDRDEGSAKGGLGWLWWLLLALLALALIWWFFLRAAPVVTATDTATTTEMTAPAMGDANSTAQAGTVAITDGAGIVSEMRDGKPVVKVYFDTAKADVVPAFGPAAVVLKAYLDSHAGSGLGVSGYNDPTGNAAANAALSMKRAEAVKAALVAAAIPETAIALVKPEAATDAATTNAEARRVEVFIK